MRPLCILLLTILLAIGMDVFFLTGFIGSDDAGYLEPARHLVEGGEIRPLATYKNRAAAERLGVVLPAIAFYWLADGNIQATSALFITFHVLLILATYLLAFLVRNARAGLISSGIVAICPLIVLHAGIVLPDIVSTFFLVVALCWIHLSVRFQRNHFILAAFLAAGFSVGLAYFAKESSLVFAPVFGVAVLENRAFRNWKRLILLALFTCLGFAAALLLEACLMKLVYGAFLTRVGAPVPETVIDNMRRLAAQQGYHPLDRTKLLARSLGDYFGLLGPVFLVGPLLYLFTRNRSWTVFVALAWLVIFNAYGTVSFSEYIPPFIQPRYFTFVVPLAAILSASAIDAILGFVSEKLKRTPCYTRAIPVTLATLLAMVLFWESLTISNKFAGVLFTTREVSTVALALDFALLNYDEPILLSSDISYYRQAPLLGKKIDSRILRAEEVHNDPVKLHGLLDNKGLLYVITNLEVLKSDEQTALHPAWVSYPERGPVHLDTEVLHSLQGNSSLIRTERIGQFHPPSSRLNGYLRTLGWYTGVSRQRSVRYSTLYRLTLEKPENP